MGGRRKAPVLLFIPQIRSIRVGCPVSRAGPLLPPTRLTQRRRHRPPVAPDKSPVRPSDRATTMLMTIYTDMRSRGLTRSARHFSTQWCGHAPNDLAEAEDGSASASTALELMRRLVRPGHRDLAQTVLNSLIVLPAADIGPDRSRWTGPRICRSDCWRRCGRGWPPGSPPPTSPSPSLDGFATSAASAKAAGSSLAAPNLKPGIFPSGSRRGSVSSDAMPPADDAPGARPACFPPRTEATP